MSSNENQNKLKKLQENPKKHAKAIFKKPVTITKVNADVIKKWIGTELQKLLPDDEIALEFILELLFGAENGIAYIHPLKEQLKDFVGKDQSEKFCLELWKLLLDAQEKPDGLPKRLVDERAKQLEERKRKLEEQALATEEQRDLLARRKATDILSQIRSNKNPKRKQDLARQPKQKGKVEKPVKSASKTNYNRS